MKGKSGPKQQKFVSYFKTGDSRRPKFQVRLYLPQQSAPGRRPWLYITEFSKELDAQICVSLVKVELAFQMLVRDIGFQKGKALLEYLDFVGHYGSEVQRGQPGGR